MSDCRRGTGAHCNCDDALVRILLSRLTTDELSQLDRLSSDVVLDSIAEANERRNKEWTVPFSGTHKKVG